MFANSTERMYEIASGRKMSRLLTTDARKANPKKAFETAAGAAIVRTKKTKKTKNR